MVAKLVMPGRFQLHFVNSLSSILFQRQNETHYVGGTEVLPPPLDAKQESEMTVSYTHLDVYQRQGGDRAPEKPAVFRYQTG